MSTVKPVRVRVVSPERSLYDGEVEHFVAPGYDGELGIWARHAPLVARLGVGVVRLHDTSGDVEKFAVRGGILMVDADEATLLVSQAVGTADAPLADLESQLENVVTELRSAPTDERFKELLTERRWLETRIAMH